MTVTVRGSQPGTKSQYQSEWWGEKVEMKGGVGRDGGRKRWGRDGGRREDEEGRGGGGMSGGRREVKRGGMEGG